MIRSEDGFRDLLDLERLRARRRGHPLALMSFASDDPGLSDGWSRLLTAGGRGALRATDAIGRLGSLEIGVLLPFTDAEDARLLCNRLQKALGADSGATSVRVQLLEAERSPEESKCRMAPGVQGEVLGEEALLEASTTR